MSVDTSHISIALLGNPNSGKSTLFNALTGLNQKTGNYAGVTVDKHYGFYKFKNLDYKVTDLPGTYSLYPKSMDEEVACKALLSEKEVVDVVVIVVDSSYLKRHLLLATQAIDLKKPCILVLNMIDEAEKSKIVIYKEELQKLMGVPVVAVNSRNKQGVQELKEAIINAQISDSVFYNFEKQQQLFPHYHSYKTIIESQFHQNNFPKTLTEFELNDNLYRFSKINYIVAKCVKQPQQLHKNITQKLDAIFTHKFFGFIFFLFILFIVFQFIFYVAEYPMAWIEESFAYFMNLASNYLPKGELTNLLVNGILAGISGIVVFVPQIALLFFFIALLEDTGYMARVSFILDKLMRGFGLNGKSVIPMISSVACAVPSIMSTRTITNLKERLITILVAPLISCSARLPVYTLFIGIMFIDKQPVFGIFNYQGLVLMSMYLLGFVAALLVAIILKYTLKTKEKSYFIMELPVYRKPQWLTVMMLVVGKVKVFLFDAGKIILAISIILWFLTSHAPGNKFDEIEKNTTLTSETVNAQKLEASYAGILGKKIEPIIQPLGFDWKIGIAIITSFAAREVFVGTMATIYSTGDLENTETLREKLVTEKKINTQQPFYTNAVCWSLLVFYAFAMQCMSTLATTYRETKHWKWPTIQLIFMSGLAYFSSLLVYQLLN